MGLLASQLGNVVQSSVGPADRSEAGGLQYTSQQLGSSVGTALIGAIVIGALASTFISNVQNDPRIPDDLKEAVTIELGGTIEFVNSGVLEEGLQDAGLPPEEIEAIVEGYEQGQLEALRLGLFVAAVIVVVSLILVRRIPDKPFDEMAELAARDEPAAST